MSDRRRTDPAAAGALLLASILTCGGIGLGIGAVVGLSVPFALTGLFAGLVVGFALVYTRFKDI
jgi:hypothetical protein